MSAAEFPARDGTRRWRDFLSVWADYNRSMGQTRDWMVKGLDELGVAASDIPPEIQF